MVRPRRPRDFRQNTTTPEIGPVPGDIEPTEALEPAETSDGDIIGPLLIPKPPSGLLKSTRTSWDRYFRSAARHVTVLSLDLDTLERLWLLYDERTRAQTELRKPKRDTEGKVIRGTSSRTVEGSMGQMRASPFYMVISRLDAEIRQLEDRVAKHMKSRLTLGMVVGDGDRADEPDEPGGAPADPLDDDSPGPGQDPRLYLVDRSAG